MQINKEKFYREDKFFLKIFFEIFFLKLGFIDGWEIHTNHTLPIT